jgi:hypothetical protein
MILNDTIVFIRKQQIQHVSRANQLKGKASPEKQKGGTTKLSD